MICPSVRGTAKHRGRKGRAVEAGQSVVEDNVTRSHKSQRTTSLLEDLIVVDSVSAELENRNFRSEKELSDWVLKIF